MVPFGFSAGDFVALGGLIIKVIKALKDHGGATDEYQNVVFELHKFKSILNQVEQLEIEVEASNLDSRKTLCELVGTSRTILQGFLTSIGKLQTSLGGHPVEQKLPLTSNWRKAQWALFMSKEVGRLRGELYSCALLIILQIQLLSHKSDLSLQKDLANMKDAIVASIHGQDENVEHIVTAVEGHFELSRRLESAIDELNGLASQEFQVLRSLISDAIIRKSTRSQGTVRRKWIEVSHTIRFQVDVDAIGEAITSQRVAIANAFKDQEAIIVSGYETHRTAWGILICLYRSALHIWSRLSIRNLVNQWGKAGSELDLYGHYTITQLDHWRKSGIILPLKIKNSEGRLFVEFELVTSASWLSSLIRQLFVVNQQTKLKPFYMRFEGTWRAQINFEDAIGRVFLLPHNWFFRSNLLYDLIESQFKGYMPASEAVENKPYALLVVSQEGGLTHFNEQAQLQSKMSVVMSVEITLSTFTHFVWNDDNSKFLAAKCIRCNNLLEDMCSLIGSKGLPSPATWKCSSCGLRISALPEHGKSSSVPLVSVEASHGYMRWACMVHYRTYALNDGSGLSRPVDDVWPDEFFDTL